MGWKLFYEGNRGPEIEFPYDEQPALSSLCLKKPLQLLKQAGDDTGEMLTDGHPEG